MSKGVGIPPIPFEYKTWGHKTLPHIYDKEEGVINFVSLDFTSWWIFTRLKYPESQYL